MTSVATRHADELAALAGSVRELREEVARLRADQAAHGCSCVHYHWSTYPAAPPPLPYQPPYTVTCEFPVTTVGMTTTGAAPVPQLQTFTVSN